MGFFRSAPFAGLYEAGAGLVLPAFRKEGVNLSLLNYLYDLLAPALGIDEAWGEAVCNHLHMQRVTERFKFVETGLEIDLMPEETFAKEGTSGRVTSLVEFRCYVPSPQAVHLPSVYEKVLRSIYSWLDAQRTLHVSGDLPPAGSSTNASYKVFDFAQVARIEVMAAGEDFEAWLKELGSRYSRWKDKGDPGSSQPFLPMGRKRGGHTARAGLFFWSAPAALVWRRWAPDAKNHRPARVGEHQAIFRPGQGTAGNHQERPRGRAEASNRAVRKVAVGTQTPTHRRFTVARCWVRSRSSQPTSSALTWMTFALQTRR